MVINISVQLYNGGFFPDINYTVLTQGYYHHWEKPRLNTM